MTLVAKMLNTAGYEVVAASDGTTAITVARKEQPKLVLLDHGSSCWRQARC